MVSNDATEMPGSEPGMATHAKTASVQPASAAMPSEGEIADLIANSPRQHDWANITARAVLALFAPILAEKERLGACLAKANANHEDFERRYYLESDRAEALKARALAAEAALAPLARIDCATETGHAFDAWPDDRVVFGIGADRVITAGDLRRARAAALAQIAAPSAAMEAP